MPIPYVILERTNNLAPIRNTHYFLKLVQHNTISLERLCKEIEKDSALSEVEVYGVLLALQSKMMQHLENGATIDLEFLGRFSLAAKVTARESKEAVSAKDVQKFSINYMPSPKMKQWLQKDFKLKKIER